MLKLRLAIVLPIIQFVFAVILLQLEYQATVPMYVPTARLICRGLNAPAALFNALDPIEWGMAPSWLPHSVFGFDTGDLFFLAGVIVVWYLVGRALDQRRAFKAAGRRQVVTAWIVYPLLLTLGGFLLFAGLQDFRLPQFSNLGYRPERAILTLIWAAGLIFVSGRGLAGAIRRRIRGEQKGTA